MKFALTALFSVLLGSSAHAMVRDLDSFRRGDECRDINRAVLNGQSCICIEVERRIDGLRDVKANAVLSDEEERNINFALGILWNKLSNARGQSPDGQFNACADSSRIEDAVWSRWQPWLSRNGFDHRNRCEIAFGC